MLQQQFPTVNCLKRNCEIPGTGRPLLLPHNCSGTVADEELAVLSSPTVILMGDHNCVRLELGAELLCLIPNDEFAVIPGADHFIVWTSPKTSLVTLIPSMKSLLEHVEEISLW